jgi:lipoprotein-releasing system permease protein
VYKLLLCWRYLLTRYLALACIISVMLGVATLIVVNSVMSGFSTKLKERLHGLLSDLVIEGTSLDGFPGAAAHMERIRQSPAGKHIQAMTPTVEVFAMLQFRKYGQTVTRPVRLLGVDSAGRAAVGGFAEYLVRQRNSPTPSFEIPPEAQWRYMNQQFQQRWPLDGAEEATAGADPNPPPPPEPPPSSIKLPRGIIPGNAIASYRKKGDDPTQPPQEIYVLEPGDPVVITTVSAGKLVPVCDRFVVCDYFKSEMSEYDSNYVFVPLDYLQRLRAMDDRVTSIQVKLKDYAHARQVVEQLRELYPEGSGFVVLSWEDKQGPLLAAISIEKGILNLLLFLIIAVAGFGILSIFSMIVVEKTRDIGILKALGASNRGVMAIFLGYGLLLGVVGAGLGTVLGLEITTHINQIEQFLTRLTGSEVFDRRVYYFNEIPTDIQPLSVLLVNLGAIGIAVLFSVLPALRAALLHPVRALRYE